MRLVLLDASVDDARTERALAVALSRAPDRLLLFGAAIATAARVAAREVAERDERYLDVAADWLLRGAGREAGALPPTRAALPVPLVDLAIAVSAGGAGPLPHAQKAIELLGGHLCMAVPRVDDLEADEPENASLWIAGGRPTGALEQNRGRPLVVPGDVIAGAGLCMVEGGGPDQPRTEARLLRVDVSGAVVETRTIPLGGGSRMQVQG